MEVFKRKLKTELRYNPAVSLLDIYPGENLKTLSRKDTCTPMFTTALFILAKTCKNLKCPSKDEWIMMLDVFIQ